MKVDKDSKFKIVFKRKHYKLQKTNMWHQQMVLAFASPHRKRSAPTNSIMWAQKSKKSEEPLKVSVQKYLILD